MLMAIIESIYETMNLRIQETAFELHLRKIYPTRNILSLRETETVSGQEGLDVQKKTDGTVNIIGEVATDPVAAWMIQAAQVASKFTLFTHHAKTFPNLVTALRNSMLRTGVFNNERTAEEQVVQVLNFDIHLVKDFRGRRYIERVTECIPIEEKNEYTFDHRKEKTLEGKFDKFFDNATIFFTKTTNNDLYKYQNVLEFVDDKYVLSNPISEKNIKEMRENMNDTDQVAFDKFLERNWGIKPPDESYYGDENSDPIVDLTKLHEERERIRMARATGERVSSDRNPNIEKQPKVEPEIQSEVQPKIGDNIQNNLEDNQNNIQQPQHPVQPKRVIKNITPKVEPKPESENNDFNNNIKVDEEENKKPKIRNQLLGGLDVNFDFGDDDDNDDDE